MNDSPGFWAAIPAAGVGKRMGGNTPKQYLPLNGRFVIDHTIQIFLDNPRIAGVYVALSQNDGWWTLTDSYMKDQVIRVNGGKERADSVLNMLDAMVNTVSEQDWVLVHDAARPCLTQDELNLLLDEVEEHDVGGLLAVPVNDTVKQVADEHVETTVPRDKLWRAFTPQMFRLGELRQALQQAFEQGKVVTDDASAMELAGFSPKIVEGKGSNLKITRPEDLALAGFYLARESG